MGDSVDEQVLTSNDRPDIYCSGSSQRRNGLTEPSELTSTYSFIGALLDDPILAGYGSNACPLFAISLNLGIEDVATFAVESLTDHPDDKKADIIYISEADGVACIAQGYTAADWGKQSAPANKASDLNTAAAWLLQSPLDQVPETIKGQAKLLRDGLTSGTINKVIFAYAHNALESPNVEAELQTVRHLVSGLDLTRNVEVEVVELGLRRIEALYLTSLGSIQVTDEIAFDAAEKLTERGPGWNAFVISLNGSVLYDLYETHKNALFSANLRDFLGARRVAGNVNNQIKETAETNPHDFFVLNNGITLVTKKADYENGVLKIYGLSIVNGAQTTGAIHAAGRDQAAKLAVVSRIIMVGDQAMIPVIVAGNNTQNSILAWDRRSNDPVQVRIKQEFEGRGITYVHRRDYTRKPATSLFADQVGQMLCAFSGDLQTAIRAKADIFETDILYNSVFPGGIGIGHIFAVQSLGWAYDAIKQELKAKSASTQLTDIEEKQRRLLDYPASKQFLIYIIGKLREEIAGVRVNDAQHLEIKSEHITANAEAPIAAWIKVIKSILPTIVQNLPAEEYQVVRSTELTNQVAERTKGIIAGAEVLGTSFQELRDLLKPL